MPIEKICPKCGSADIYIDSDPMLDNNDSVYIFYGCNHCGVRWAAYYDLQFRDIEILEEEDR